MKSAEDRAKLHAMIATADVFLTNVRQKALNKLKMDYGSLHALYPHLIYAHLSAWGQSGPDKDLPGYDSAAFYNMSGLSSSINVKGTYHCYPVGFGDMSTGQGLLGAILAALVARLR